MNSDIPKMSIPWSENKIIVSKAPLAYKQALNIHFNVCPCLSDKYPNIGPPATPPTSNNVDNNPETNGVYPRESFRYNGSHR